MKKEEDKQNWMIGCLRHHWIQRKGGMNVREGGRGCSTCPQSLPWVLLILLHTACPFLGSQIEVTPQERLSQVGWQMQLVFLGGLSLVHLSKDLGHTSRQSFVRLGHRC